MNMPLITQSLITKRSTSVLARMALALGVAASFSVSSFAASYDSGTGKVKDAGQGVDVVKDYLLQQVTKMDAAADDFVKNAEAYKKIIDANGGDYSKAALASGPEILALIEKMKNDYRGLHMKGYETVEGIAAGVQSLVYYDVYFDSGVPKSEASTDTPAAPVVLKTADGEPIVNHEGNIFHYVIEPTLWSVKKEFVVKVSAAAAAKLNGLTALPRADVVLATAKATDEKVDKFLADCRAWNPAPDQCIGALVWMTPTFNSYFDDLRDSLYDPSAKYISESRVLDMRGIMGSLQLIYEAIMPQIEVKDPALAKQLKSEYAAIMHHIDVTDARDRKTRAAGGKLSKQEIQEMEDQAKTMSDQLAPQLEQAATILGLKIPPKPDVSAQS